MLNDGNMAPHDNSSKISLSVVIPLYNEAFRIEKCFSETLSYFKNISDRLSGLEIIFVSEPSADGTNGILRSLIDAHPEANIKFLINDKREGKGYSIKRGFFEARNDWVLFYDVDLSVPLDEFSRFLPYAATYDIIIASRLLSDSSVTRSFFRRVLSRGLYFLRRTMFKTNVKDSQCGFKMFRRVRSARIVEQTASKNFFFDVELITLAERAGLQIKEMPVKWIHGLDSSYSVSKTIIHFLIELARLRVRLWMENIK